MCKPRTCPLRTQKDAFGTQKDAFWTPKNALQTRVPRTNGQVFLKKAQHYKKRRIWFREVIFEKAFKKGPLETPVRIYVHNKTRASIWICFLTRKRGWFCYESRVSWLYPGYAAKPIIDNHGNSASGSIGPSEVPPAQSECSPKRQIRPVTKISTALMAKCKHRRMIWNMKCEIWKMKYETWQDMSRCEIWNVTDWIWDMRCDMMWDCMTS